MREKLAHASLIGPGAEPLPRIFVSGTKPVCMWRYIPDDLSLAALDILAGVEGAWSGDFCRLDALLVDNGRCQFFIATKSAARGANERGIEKIKGAAVTQSVETKLHSRVRSTMPRLQRPPEAGRGDMRHGVPNLPRI